MLPIRSAIGLIRMEAEYDREWSDRARRRNDGERRESAGQREAALMETSFTPWSGLAGGFLIGLASTALFAADGKIAGISGILGRSFFPAAGDLFWRLAFLTQTALQIKRGYEKNSDQTKNLCAFQIKLLLKI